MRLIFFSSVSYGCNYIDFFLKKKIEIASVITNPPKKAGRGLKIKINTVSSYSKKLGLKVLEVEDLISIEKDIRKLKPDLGIVVGFGRHIPRKIFEIPKKGTFNIHFSYLPHLRGPAPVEWAILKGYKETGVTIFKLNDIIDEGDIYLREKIKILPEETKEELLKKLIERSFFLLDEFLKRLEKNGFNVIKQEKISSFAPKIKKEDAFISWEESEIEISRKLRALNPTPGCWTLLPDGKILKIISAKKYPYLENLKDYSPGTVVSIIKPKGFLIRNKDGFFIVERVKPEGKREMTGMEFIRGRIWLLGKTLGKKQ